MLETRHLALVRAVAATGSLTRAGESLHLTQSALSHQLLDLEHRLGLRLFHRVGRRMVLSPAGTRVLACAERVLPDLERTREELRSAASGRQGVLRLTMGCHTAFHWLPAVMRAFAVRHPGIEVRLDPAILSRPLDAVLDGTVDVAVVSGEVVDPRLRTARLFRDEIVALVAPGHALSGRRSVTPERLAEETLLSYVPFTESTAWKAAFVPAGVTPARTLRIPLTEAMIEFVRGGLGVAVVPRWSVVRHVEAGNVVALRIGRRGIVRHWEAVTLGRDTPGWLADFIAELRALPAAARGVASA